MTGQGPREGVLRPGRRDEQAGPGPGVRLWAGHVGVRARAGPDGYARRPDALALLDGRLYRLAGGPLLRVLGHHALPLSQRRRASDHPSNPERGLDYPTGPNVAEGIEHLQMLGVKYFMAETPDIEAQANADSNLQLVATVGPFPVSYTTGSTTSVQQRTWNIYEVADSAEVAPLVYQPVVMTGVSQGGQALARRHRSRGTSTPAGGTSSRPPPAPRTGPGSPPRTTTLPRTPLPPVHVSDIHEGTQTISFDVDQTASRFWSRRRISPTGRSAGRRGSTG